VAVGDKPSTYTDVCVPKCASIPCCTAPAVHNAYTYIDMPIADFQTQGTVTRYRLSKHRLAGAAMLHLCKHMACRQQPALSHSCPPRRFGKHTVTHAMHRTTSACVLREGSYRHHQLHASIHTDSRQPHASQSADHPGPSGGKQSKEMQGKQSKEMQGKQSKEMQGKQSKKM
jgi:hypothetical protein